MSTPTATPLTDAQEIDLSTHIATEGFSPNRRKVDKYVPSKLARTLETELIASQSLCARRDDLLLKAQTELAAAKTECERLQWELDAKYRGYTAELARLRAEVERLTIACNNFSNAEIAEGDWKARAERAEAEVERLEAEALRWSLLAKSNAQAHNRTEDERFNLFLEVKKLRAEQQAQQEINKPAK